MNETFLVICRGVSSNGQECRRVLPGGLTSDPQKYAELIAKALVKTFACTCKYVLHGFGRCNTVVHELNPPVILCEDCRAEYCREHKIPARCFNCQSECPCGES